MGTSVSQPSPKASATGGAEWKEVKNSIKTGTSPQEIVRNILLAFSAEYGADTQNILIDNGVRRVAHILDTKINSGAPRDEFLVASFIVETRKQLAITSTNSFFAELALTAGSKAILQGGTNFSETFAAEFASKIIDYVISRDLPSTIGSTGLTNLESMDRLLNTVVIEFKQKASESLTANSISILENLLTIPGQNNE